MLLKIIQLIVKKLYSLMLIFKINCGKFTMIMSAIRRKIQSRKFFNVTNPTVKQLMAFFTIYLVSSFLQTWLNLLLTCDSLRFSQCLHMCLTIQNLSYFYFYDYYKYKTIVLSPYALSQFFCKEFTTLRFQWYIKCSEESFHEGINVKCLLSLQ